MNLFSQGRDAIVSLIDTGGPVVAILLVMSVLSAAVILFKTWQFYAAGVGRHSRLDAALFLWDADNEAAAQNQLATSPSHLAPLVCGAMKAVATRKDNTGLPARIEASAQARFAKLEGGFRLLDSIAQLSPLLGLFGTVLGMIEAFRQLQGAGAAVDPSLLAGGIWVALMTTAVGLAVAMPTALLLTWLESRVAAERSFADTSLQRVFCPGVLIEEIKLTEKLSATDVQKVAAHAG